MPSWEFQQGQYAGHSKDWVLDPGELEAAFSPKTKMIIVNNPNNPLGKVQLTRFGNFKCYYIVTSGYTWKVGD